MEKELLQKANDLKQKIDVLKDDYGIALNTLPEDLNKAETASIYFADEKGTYLHAGGYRVPAVLLKDIIKKAPEYYKKQLETLEEQFKQL